MTTTHPPPSSVYIQHIGLNPQQSRARLYEIRVSGRKKHYTYTRACSRVSFGFSKNITVIGELLWIHRVFTLC